MIRTIGTIKEFIKIKDNCIFCDQPLTPLLTNLLGSGAPKIADIKVPLYNDQFKFRLKYPNLFDVNIYINIKDNKFGFFLYGPSAARYEDVAHTFEDMRPCIELLCDNKNCGMEYYIQSNYIDINENNYIDPLGIFLESFSVNKLWVANCYSSPNHITHTWIYSLANPNANSINAPRMDFSSYPKDRLVNRIKTIVNFG